MFKKVYTREEIQNSLMKEANREMGICEKLRTIYDVVYTLPESEQKTNITEQLVDALLMAKKMSDRFAYYVETYHDSTGHQGRHLKAVNQKALLQKRKERV